MKNMFYATRLDKEGNKLTTSYGTEKMAKTYGGNGKISETIFTIDFETNEVLEGDIGDRPVIRSLLVNNGTVGADLLNGKFRLYGRNRGEWEFLKLTFDSYGAANALMKAMIGQFEALTIVGPSDTKTVGPTSDYVSEGIM